MLQGFLFSVPMLILTSAQARSSRQQRPWREGGREGGTAAADGEFQAVGVGGTRHEPPNALYLALTLLDKQEGFKETP